MGTDNEVYASISVPNTPFSIYCIHLLKSGNCDLNNKECTALKDFKIFIREVH